MQDRYVGDIGDFGKYGLLRRLLGFGEVQGSGCGLKLGIIWYRTNLGPSENRNSDGERIKYLDCTQNNHNRFRNCDELLYDKLRAIVRDGHKNREVKAIKKRGILLSDVYYDEVLTSSSRDCWFKGALKSTKDVDVVFVDPDNGIKVQSPTHKHVSIEELRCIFQRGQSLIIYHQLSRDGSAIQQMKRVSGWLQQSFDLWNPFWILWYHRDTARFYFILPQKEYKDVLEARVKDFLSTDSSATDPKQKGPANGPPQNHLDVGLPLSPLLQRHVLQVHLPDVLQQGAYEYVVLVLLHAL